MTVKLSQGSTSCFLSLKVAFKFIQPHKPHRLWLKAPYVSCFFFFFLTHGWDQWFAARNVCLTKWITPSSLNSPVILACTFTFLEVFVVRPQERGEGGAQFASDAGFTLSITQHHNHNPEPTNPPSLLLHLTAEGIRWLQSVLQQARTGVVVGVN